MTQIPNAVVGHVADSMFGLLLTGVASDAVADAVGDRIPAEIRVPGSDPDLKVLWTAVQVHPDRGEMEQLSTAERKLARLSGSATR